MKIWQEDGERDGGGVVGARDGGLGVIGEKAHEAAERLRGAAENAPVGMALKDASGRILWSNPAMQGMLGYSDDELRGMFRTEFTHPNDVGDDALHYEELARGERGGFRAEKRYVKKDGGIVWGLLSVSRIEGGDGLALVVVEDVDERKKAEEALRASEGRFRTVIEQSPLGIHVFAPDGTSLRANTAWKELWYLAEGEETEGHAIYEDEQLRATGLLPYVEDSVRKEAAVTTPPLLYDPARTGRGGDPRWLESSVYPVRDGDGAVHEMALLVEDVTERKEAEERLRRSEENLAEAQRLAHLGSWEWDAKTDALSWSDEVFRIYGFDPRSFVPTFEKLLAVVHPEDRWMLGERFDGALRRGEPYDFEHRVVRPDGAVRTVHRRGEVDRGGDGEPLRMFGTVHDVTERKALEEELEHRALHDPLTGLPNRALLEDRLAQALKRSGRRRRGVAVLFMDLDNFKVINDSLGHDAGDGLLVAASGRMTRLLRPGDTVARLGGDEFIFLLEDADAEVAAGVVERVLGGLREPFALKEREVSVTASIGIALFGDAEGDAAEGGKRPEDLLREADLAMYRAKREGKERYAVFEEAMNTRALERLETEQGLRRALERGELRVFYQPKVSLASGEISGFEALARWEHPEKGLLLPETFIPVAEETGLIVPLGRWVLREACRRAKGWQDAARPSDPPPTVSVNLSIRQFRDPDLAGEVARVLRETGLDPACLDLEITESAAMGDAPATAATLERLKALGVRISIDDFGTGYSSLSYLERFFVDRVKIDRTFISRLGDDSGAAVLASGIVGLAHALGLEVVAEGVETGSQLERLREMGCNAAQGYYFSEPLPGGAADALLRARSGR